MTVLHRSGLNPTAVFTWSPPLTVSQGPGKESYSGWAEVPLDLDTWTHTFTPCPGNSLTLEWAGPGPPCSVQSWGPLWSVSTRWGLSRPGPGHSLLSPRYLPAPPPLPYPQDAHAWRRRRAPLGAALSTTDSGGGGGAGGGAGSVAGPLPAPWAGPPPP